ncbi:large ribosomal RNA subunit accumulation protein YCED homolog 2, chloroplastic isoform X1 [Cynara cardunculus var. scolymus]|uniref:large ribosomal RNA subunit accumulation protein YCED homolog 2, chloroplastic isoform X1 n=1 Tax=Cynara cardunculus var. scolymus TaxID=59895 RepID=UPI000D62967A|nr:large ribosomal RNA subunit accumulation protein YCED homolog 2, chloroplastic isoform X1 [Cynara cardunculus var. scolymus]XP_024994500.1 large ribosomal RNA subunit accumulation protein YCED homolog 2, chloroplastic isoform X1 [Cynara cardunculus var. scolymus]
MGYCIPGTLTSPLPPSNPTHTKSLRYTLSASIQRNQIPLIGKKVGRRLIRISTAEGKWQGNWNADYNFSLRDLRLDDLVEDDDPNDARVFVSLSIHRHAGFGLSVDGTIDTSFTRKCSNCSSPYCRQITTNFNVWVLPSAKDGDSNQLPEIGGDDPSVIYVKPGCEADLDSLIQDTIRLTTSVNETCSDFCEKSELGLRHVGNAKAPTVDKRWSKLLELKKSYQ